MRRLLLLLVILLPVRAFGITLNCEVPQPYAARGATLCEMLRVDIPARGWDDNDCATEFLRRGLREYDAGVTRKEAAATVENDVSNALSTFDTSFPTQYTKAVCGDSIVDTEFGEECDPPDGVTCDQDCRDIP